MPSTLGRATSINWRRSPTRSKPNLGRKPAQLSADAGYCSDANLEGILLQELAHQFQCDVLVSLGLDQHIEDLAFGVNRPPEVDHAAVDFQIDLVQMPSRVRFRATLSQIGRDHRSELVHPTPNRLVRHRHSAFRQQIFDVAQAEGEPEVKPYRLLNDLGREAIPAVADLVHPRGATPPPRTPQARSAVIMPSRALFRKQRGSG